MQSPSSVLGVTGSVRRLVARGRPLAAPSCPGAANEPGFGQNLKTSGALSSVYHWWTEASATVPPVPPGSLPGAPGHASSPRHHHLLSHDRTGACESLREAQEDVPLALEPMSAARPVSLLRWQGPSVAHSTVPGVYLTGTSTSSIPGGFLAVCRSPTSRHWTRGLGLDFFPDCSDYRLQHPCRLLSTQGSDGDASSATLQSIGESDAIAAAEGSLPEALGTEIPSSEEGQGLDGVAAGTSTGEGVLGAGGTEGALNADGAQGVVSLEVAEGTELDEFSGIDALGIDEEFAMGSKLVGSPRRVQRFMIQKLLKVKPTEPPSTAALRKKFQMRIVDINRTAKVTKGGKVISFAALVVCGNGEGVVGFGRGKSAEVGAAVDKAFARSLRNLHYFERYRGRTVAMEQVAKYGKTKVYLWPAAKGSSMSAGTVVGGILRLAGFTEVKTKVIGSRNPINTVKATFKALGLIESASESASEEAALG